MKFLSSICADIDKAVETILEENGQKICRLEKEIDDLQGQYREISLEVREY
jgi:hypothetical protein